MRTIWLAAAAAVCALAAPVGTAFAGAPTIVTATRVVAPSNAAPITAACGFTVLQAFTLDTRTITFTDDTGALVRRITHASFDGSLIEASTGEALPWHGVWTQILDVGAGTITVDGLRQDLLRADGTPGAVMVGHGVYAAAGFPATPLEESTRADFAAWWSAVCGVFAS